MTGHLFALALHLAVPPQDARWEHRLTEPAPLEAGVVPPVRGRGLRTAGLVAISAGATLTAVGTAVWTTPCHVSPGDKDCFSLWSSVGLLMIPVGALGVVGGTSMLVVGEIQLLRSERTTLNLQALPGGAGISGTF